LPRRACNNENIQLATANLLVSSNGSFEAVIKKVLLSPQKKTLAGQAKLSGQFFFIFIYKNQNSRAKL